MVTQEKLERQVYCHNFPFRSSWQDLKDYMRAAGEVEHVKIMEGPTGRSRVNAKCWTMEFGPYSLTSLSSPL
eukprot:g1581.t1